MSPCISATDALQHLGPEILYRGRASTRISRNGTRKEEERFNHYPSVRVVVVVVVCKIKESDEIKVRSALRVILCL
jgi:hypothetical protein